MCTSSGEPNRDALGEGSKPLNANALNKTGLTGSGVDNRGDVLPEGTGSPGALIIQVSCRGGAVRDNGCWDGKNQSHY